MATEVVMPQMGESIAEGTITKWLVQPGDKVERDQPLFEISTDKVDAEIPSPIAGTLKEIKAEEGQTVPVNDVVALVEEEARRITTARNAFRADQFNHPGNAAAHAATTGPELWADSGGTLTAFADFAGSGGSYAGVMLTLKQANPSLKGYIVEPEGAAAISGAPVTAPCM